MAKGTAFQRFTPLRESQGGRLQSQELRGRRLYRGVTIIKAGLGNARDRNFYPASVLEANVAKFNGLRAYADHQDSLSEEVQPERTVRDMVGVYTKPRFVREGRHGGRIVADLHLLRSAKWLSDTVDDLIDLGQADKIGLSINGRGRTVEKQLSAGELGLEEAADPINVNWVEDFLVLRSADVVTEAGAGGGFHQLLESAREAQETEMKLTDQQKSALKAAVDAGDVEKLNALMQECGCTEAPAAPVKAAKKAAPAVEAEADEADAEDEDAEDAEEDTLEAEAEAIVEEEEAAQASDDEGDGDDADDVDTEEADAEAETVEAGPYKASGMPKGAGKLISGRAHGKHGGTIKGPKETKGSFTKAGSQKSQPGKRFGEAEASVEKLRKQLSTLQEENARLSAQLRVRTTTDRAKKLIQESAIPRKIQPDVLRLCVGKSENEMRNVIRYHERLIEAAADEFNDSPVEGAGSTRFRESHHGGADDSLTSVLDDIGLPVRGSK